MTQEGDTMEEQEKKEQNKQEQLKKMSSPEQLNDYITVTSPGVWLVLGGIAVLLIGALIWSILGRLDTYMDAVMVVDETGAQCYVPAVRDMKIKAGMPVHVNAKTFHITDVSSQPREIDETFHSYASYLLGGAGKWVYVLETDAAGLESGVYEAQITVDSISPISFVLN